MDLMKEYQTNSDVANQDTINTNTSTSSSSSSISNTQQDVQDPGVQCDRCGESYLYLERNTVIIVVKIMMRNMKCLEKIQQYLRH